MFNIDLNYSDFLKEVFTSELALNEKTVIDFCNDILSDKY
jgi:hypothetical protein